MFKGKDIVRVVALMDREKLFLYHSCQLREFQTFLRARALPCAGRLLASGAPLTQARTLAWLEKKGLGDIVILRGLDQGAAFERGQDVLPNVHGPIQLVFRSEALLAAENAHVSVRPCSAPDFTREGEGLASPDDYLKLFRYDKHQGLHSPFPSQLRELFPGLRARHVTSAPEWTVKFASGACRLDYLERVIVDPIACHGHRLCDQISALLLKAGFGHVRVVERSGRSHGHLYQAFFDAASRQEFSLKALAEQDFDPELRGFAQAISCTVAERRFLKCASALYEGTFVTWRELGFAARKAA